MRADDAISILYIFYICHASYSGVNSSLSSPQARGGGDDWGGGGGDGDGDGDRDRDGDGDEGLGTGGALAAVAVRPNISSSCGKSCGKENAARSIVANSRAPESSCAAVGTP